MKNRIYYLAFLLATSSVFAQSDDPVGSYLAVAGEHSPVYTGKIPIPYPAYFTNHPYLSSETFKEGELSFSGITYPGILMRLDWYRDRLLVIPPGGLHEVILSPAQVGHATLYGRHIIYHQPDSLKGSPPKGYYLLLYQGDCRILSRTACSMREMSKDGVVTGWFTFSDKYYLLKDGVWREVRRKGSVLKAFPSHKKELSRFIAEHKPDFRRNAGEAITAVVKEYERIKAGL
jgi:hypothetical protein